MPRRLARARPDRRRARRLKLVKVNIDEEQALAQRYGVASIPTMVLFKDGEPQASASARSRRARSRRLSASQRLNERRAASTSAPLELVVFEE